MKTVSIGIQNNCAACGCACRYCLLRSNKRADDGVDYARGKRLAERFLEWGRAKELQSLPYYFIGYCAEYPELLDTIEFNRRAQFPGAGFLQVNGISLRDTPETDAFVRRLRDAGVESIDTTFYGTETYHDRFAARKGDFRFLLRLVESAAKQGLHCTLSVPLSTENLPMLAELLYILAQMGDLSQLVTFLPDYRGRGDRMEEIRLTEAHIEQLPTEARKALNLKRYKTEREWLSEGALPEYTQRALIVNLRRDNIDMLEAMSCEEIVAYVEALDDAYYRAIPDINTLAEMYGDRENARLYKLRDLFWKWQKRYIAEKHLELYDVTDERFCASIRS